MRCAVGEDRGGMYRGRMYRGKTYQGEEDWDWEDQGGENQRRSVVTTGARTSATEFRVTA